MLTSPTTPPIRTMPISPAPATRRRRVLPAVLAALGLLVTACVSSEPPAADVPPVVVPAVTTQPAVPPEPVTDEVVSAIEEYWEQRDAAFADSPEAGIAFVVANNHPQLPYTVEQCNQAWFGGEVPVGFAERTALLAGSIESDPGWTMVAGPLAGRDLGAGLFSMIVAFSYEGEGLRVADRVASVHLQVTGSQVRQFLVCDPIEVTVVPAPTTPPTAAAPAAPSTPPTALPSDPITLPPITATPSPVDPPGNGTGPPPPPATPPPTGNRPPGSGIDFCDEGDPGAQPVAGDYFLCPDTDIDNSTGEDGGSSEPSPAP